MNRVTRVQNINVTYTFTAVSFGFQNIVMVHKNYFQKITSTRLVVEKNTLGHRRDDPVAKYPFSV